MIRPLIFKIAVSITTLFGFIRVSYSAEVVDKIVAVVNDEVITQSELEESMLPFIADYKMRYGTEGFDTKLDRARQDAINRLIEEKLILQEAQKRKIIVDEQEIEDRMTEVKSRFKDEDEFHKVLEDSGVTIAKLKRRYEEQLKMKRLVNDLISEKVHITPTQIASYYYAHQKDFETPRRVRFKILLLKPTETRSISQTEELALQLIERIKTGSDFDSLVREYSQGPNVDKGGDMDYMPQDDIITEIGEALCNIGPGEISRLIKTDSGFNIVKLVDRQDIKIKNLSDVTDEIRERLFQREAELTLREFVDKLKKDAYISIK